MPATTIQFLLSSVSMAADNRNFFAPGASRNLGFQNMSTRRPGMGGGAIHPQVGLESTLPSSAARRYCFDIGPTQLRSEIGGLTYARCTGERPLRGAGRARALTSMSVRRPGSLDRPAPVQTSVAPVHGPWNGISPYLNLNAEDDFIVNAPVQFKRGPSTTL